MAKLHLIIGPVGSGKSTLAMKLSETNSAVRLVLDEWMAVLFGDDERPAEDRIEWYVARTQRCLEQIWQVTQDLMRVGTSVVLEVGLIQSDPRRQFYDLIDDAGFDHTVYVVDAARDVRRERVLRRNVDRGETFSVEVPPEFFELASDLWEPPSETERSSRNLVDILG